MAPHRPEQEAVQQFPARHYCLGIDPGLDGGLAVVKGNKTADVIRMPCLTIYKDRKERRSIERWRLAFWVRHAVKKWDLKYAVIEQVASSPQMGVVSAFKFGQGYGEVLGVLESYGLVIHFVHPALWKPHMQLSRDKNLSK